MAWDADQERHPGDARIDRLAAGKWARVPVPRLSPLVERIEIVTRGGGRQLVKRPIPAGERVEGVAHPSRIQADDAGTIWISAYRMDHGKLLTADVNDSPLYRGVVLRSGPARREPVFLWESAAGDAVKRAVENANVRASGATRAPRDKPFAAATAGCKDVFVVIAAVPRSTAADYGFPLTARAVKGRRDLAEVRYVEAIMSQKRVFGAMAPSFEAGKKLADVLSTAMPGAKPQVLCGEPFVTRAVTLASVP